MRRAFLIYINTSTASEQFVAPVFEMANYALPKHSALCHFLAIWTLRNHSDYRYRPSLGGRSASLLNGHCGGGTLRRNVALLRIVAGQLPRITACDTLSQ